MARARRGVAGAFRGPGRVDERQVEGEGAPLAGHADEADLAAQEGGELAGDRQAEAGAAVLAARPGVGLLKGLEDELLLLRRDPDPGVAMAKETPAGARLRPGVRASSPRGAGRTSSTRGPGP